MTDQITGPDGTVWKVGDKVMRYPLDASDGDPKETTITRIFPGNGSFERDQPKGDHNAVWFYFADGWAARPWLVKKVD